MQIVHRLCVICGLVLLNCLNANGQQQESLEGFMSGIRANAVKGEVVHQRNEGKFPLEAGLRLEEGDVIRSGDGYAELLLQPGNYLRAAGGTELQIFSDQYDKMRLKLNAGTINLEILARESSNYWWYPMEKATELIRVITPDAEVFIAHPGVFRISTTNSGRRTEVVVREGEAVINGHKVKKKRRAVAANGNVTIAEIDSRTEDNFDAWSRERAGQLVQANKQLKNEPPWSTKTDETEAVVDLPEGEENNSRGLVISARPGAVNFVEAGVEFRRAAKEWEPLTEKSQLEDGDTLRTRANSLVELTLFPDMHFRLDQSSEVLLDELSNDSISLKVLRGSAIVDVARFDRKQSPKITIGGSSTSAIVNDHGNYRVDARGGSNTITVREGKVIFNERSVSGCKRIDGVDFTTISDCDKKRSDNFDFWSQHRGEGELYNGRGMVSMVTHLTRLRRHRFRNGGFWYQQPGKTSYTFVPFTSQFFRSPYGGNYSTVLTPRRNSRHKISNQ